MAESSPKPASRPMKPILRAMALLSGGSAVSLVLGLVSAKVMALLLGPVGVGHLGLLQSTLGLAVLAATMGGVSVGMVRVVAKARAGDKPADEGSARAATWILCWVLAGCSAVAMFVLRAPLARLLLGAPERADAILPLALALVLSVATSVQTSILSAHHRIGDLGRIGVSNSILGPALLLPLAWLWRESALPWAICAGGVATVTASSYYVRRNAPRPSVHVSRREIAAAARKLLRFGIPFNASAFAGNGVQLAMPVLVLHTLGSTSVGFYRAAASVSLAYLGFLLAALGQDYYPRLSAHGNDPAHVARLVNDQIRAVLLLIGPVILALLTLVPYLVPVIYTPQFAPTIALLQWQLVGDVLKVSSWTLGFAILARCGGLTYLCAELASGTSLLLFSWIGLRLFRLEGLGMAFLASNGVSFLVYWTILRRVIGLRLTRENQFLLGAFLLAAVAIRMLPYAGVGHLVTPLGLAATAAGTIWSSWIIWGELGGLRGVMAWRGVS